MKLNIRLAHKKALTKVSAYKHEILSVNIFTIIIPYIKWLVFVKMNKVISRSIGIAFDD
ncbi:polar amino acid ABC transporter, inner membrane subunit [Weissella oryzae SG25]|uniref:Polar amino acid ABC transporter, inner membrane subunit n=1 Tax=Weissella oryzae (strain DSM 25784 / JCM 18191 / LMG 30913 / SG25) TaxID=1329250 RepID=A0A069CTQ9_WEIOS|nr:polar amino acid ABC transporter, inner membrane subunit [Weissella oryzae SG25]